MEMPYQGIATFLKSQYSPWNRTANRFGFAGIPYDRSTSFRPGARLAPNAIRNASLMLTDGDHPIFHCMSSLLISDYGDIPVSTVNPVTALQEIENGVHAIKKVSKKVLFAGGDHLITLGVLRALHHEHGKMACIHFDAHCDTWALAFGEKYGHGTWLRNAIEEGLVDSWNVISLGIRSPIDGETKSWTDTNVRSTFSMNKVDDTSIKDICDNIELVVGNLPTYITFDIDALDPAHAPGTGTPEIGGMTSLKALRIMQEIFSRDRNINFIGMDVVEVNPAYDPSGITSLAAATLLWTFAAGVMENEI